MQVRVIGNHSLSKDHLTVKDNHMDVLVATPGRLQHFLEEGITYEDVLKMFVI